MMQGTVAIAARARGFAWVLGLLALGLWPRPAEAHKRDFAWTYEWFTPLQNEKEVELWLTYKSEEKEWQPWLEYEFAVTPRYAMGIYLTSEASENQKLKMNGWKWEHRYRLGEFKPNRWLHAGYLELKKETGEPHELEGKWLLSKYTKKDEALAINLIAEKELAAGGSVKWEYSIGWNKPVRPNWRLGAEAFGEFREGRHFLGPDFTYDIPQRNFRLIFGAGVGMGQASGELQMRTIGEFEFF